VTQTQRSDTELPVHSRIQAKFQLVLENNETFTFLINTRSAQRDKDYLLSHIIAMQTELVRSRPFDQSFSSQRSMRFGLYHLFPFSDKIENEEASETVPEPDGSALSSMIKNKVESHRALRSAYACAAFFSSSFSASPEEHFSPNSHATTSTGLPLGSRLSDVCV
jgi:hypothetical protein